MNMTNYRKNIYDQNIKNFENQNTKLILQLKVLPDDIIKNILYPFIILPRRNQNNIITNDVCSLCQNILWYKYSHQKTCPTIGQFDSDFHIFNTNSQISSCICRHGISCKYLPH
jgi:hypothetical protein